MPCARFAIYRAAVFLWVGSIAVSLVSCQKAEAVTQPMQFDHQRHMKADIDCLTCHERAADGQAATMPALRVCSKCHKEVQGKDPAVEQPILDAVAKKQNIPWVQVNHLAGHVYFSHRPHVGFAEMKCEACHGDMSAQVAAVSVPNVHLSMQACMNCHEAKNASNDCLTCHK